MHTEPDHLYIPEHPEYYIPPISQEISPIKVIFTFRAFLIGFSYKYIKIIS